MAAPRAADTDVEAEAELDRAALAHKRAIRQDLLNLLLGFSSERGGSQLRRPTVTGRWDAACGHAGCYVIEIHCPTDSQATRWLERLLAPA